MDAAVLGSFEHYARLYPGDILGSWVVGWPVVYSVLVCPAGGGKGNRHWALLGRNCNSILFSTGSGSSPGGGAPESESSGTSGHFWAETTLFCFRLALEVPVLAWLCAEGNRNRVALLGTVRPKLLLYSVFDWLWVLAWGGSARIGIE